MVGVGLNANDFLVIRINNEAALRFAYPAKRFLDFHKRQPYQ
jgi:hypothetical protein